ncbi:MAG: HEAT repeat domain-containing protein [Fibrobacteres bacterium]|nr:HEAT repeat domain-containing protein [Fibrobacterota bacterium]
MEDLRHLLLSADDNEIREGLKRISIKNLTVNLPCLMEIIKGRSIHSKEASEIAADKIKAVFTSGSKIDDKSREALVRLLLQVEPDVMQSIIRDFKVADPRKKIDLIYLLKSFNDEKASVRMLLDSLHDANRLVRACAVKTLGKIADHREPGIIARFLSDRDSRVRANAVEAIEDSKGTARLTGFLVRLKNDTNNRVRGNVLKALFLSGYKDAEKELRIMLADADELMCSSGVWAVGEIGKLRPSKAEVLLEMLEIATKNSGQIVQTNILLARDKIAKSRMANGERVSKEDRTLKGQIIERSSVNISREVKGRFDVVKVSGCLNVYSMIPLKLKINESLEAVPVKLALDFTMVDDVDASVMRFIKNLNKKVKDENGGRFMIFGLKPEVRDAFSLANLDTTVLVFGRGEKIDHLF